MTREEWQSILKQAKRIVKKDYPYKLSVFGGKVQITTKLLKSIIVKDD